MSQPTTVTGYYNPQSYPLQIIDSALGLRLTLEKGAFVKDNKGNKINDQRLEAFVGPQMLARETSREAVPAVNCPGQGHVRTVPAIGQPAAPLVRETLTPVSLKAPATPKLPVPATPPTPVPVAPARPATLPAPLPAKPAARAAGSGPVSGMSMDDAVRLGLVKKIEPLKEDYGMKDDGSSSINSAGAPEIAIPFERPRRQPAPSAAAPAMAKQILDNLPLREAAPEAQHTIARLAADATYDPEDPTLLNRLTSEMAAEAGVAPASPVVRMAPFKPLAPPPAPAVELPAPDLEEEASPEEAEAPKTKPKAKKPAAKKAKTRK